MTAHETSDGAAERHADSPCTGVCVIDPITDCCQGCFRTLDEIATWGSTSAPERLQILDRVERRKTDADG